MNDRAINILEQYDFQVLRTWKGRGAFLFETPTDTLILKEYCAALYKLGLQEELLKGISEKSSLRTEKIFRNKENELYSVDMDKTAYIVKTYPQGRECNIKESDEYLKAVTLLAKLHKAMENPDLAQDMSLTELPFLTECKKRTKELIKARKFLKQKSQKTEFELYLCKVFDIFLSKAMEIQNQLSAEDCQGWSHDIINRGLFCHGDFQHHNIMVDEKGFYIINFEKFTLDNPVKDLYLFMRKLLEKNQWNPELAMLLFLTYENERPLCEQDKKQLLYKFMYPEKFWKIVNFYYNSPKSWLPGKNREKLEQLVAIEKQRENCIEILKNI